MKKKCKVVMSPTKKDSYLHKNVNNEIELLSNKVYWTLNSNPQHLHLISDDEIKEGDNVYSKHYGLGVVIEDNHPNYKGEFPIRVKYPNIIVPYFNDGGYSSDRKLIYLQDCKKVIASTDPELVFNNKVINANYGVKMEGFHHKQLPQIPESFIKSYVEAGGIDEVMVEYEQACIDDCPMGCDGCGAPMRLKLTDNNEVVIVLPSLIDGLIDVQVKLNKMLSKGKMYSRDEVVKMFWDCHNGVLDEDQIKWIEENL